MDKARLNNTLKSLGFLVPKYIETFERSKINKINFFPIILKPRTGGKGSSNVFIAQSPKQLIALADYLNISDKSSDFIIQEYTGTPEQEYTVGILHDKRGVFIDGITLKRDLTKSLSVRSKERNLTGQKILGEYLVVSSGVSQGVIGAFPKITNQCRKIADALGSTGPLNIQCRLIDGKVSVFEINPRFSGTTSLRAIAGLNEPDLLIQSKFGILPKMSNLNRSDKIIERVLIDMLIK